MSLEWKCADSNGGLQCTFVTRILRLCMRLLATRQAAHRIDNQFTPMLTLYEQTVGFALEELLFYHSKGQCYQGHNK